jgi:hypothetical protein
MTLLELTGVKKNKSKRTATTQNVRIFLLSFKNNFHLTLPNESPTISLMGFNKQVFSYSKVRVRN